MPKLSLAEEEVSAPNAKVATRDPSSGKPAAAQKPLATPRIAQKPSAAQRYRFVRAYWTTFLVLGSYLSFSLGRRLFGPAWGDAHIADVHARNARRVERTIVKLQGLFIKVGQLLSIMANFLPAQFRSGLEGLQDQVPPRPYSEIAARIRDELGEEVEEIFERFCQAPIASASLGQVHEAWLKDGTHVAVKVQHHNIDEIVRLDLTTIRRIMGIVSIFVPVQGLDAYYHQIRMMISEELDFIREARNINRIADNFLKQPNVRFPGPIEGLGTRRVMVATFVEGVKVGDVAALSALGVGSARPREADRAGLLSADLHRRHLPRRSAPREHAGRPGWRAHPPRFRRRRGALARDA